MLRNDRRTAGLGTGVALIALALTAGACSDEVAPMAPALGTGEGPGMTTPAAQSDTVRGQRKAASKLDPMAGHKISGEIEIFEQGDELVVIGKASGMDPASSYVLLIHLPSTTPSEGCVSPDTPGVELGSWRVQSNGVGNLKTVVKNSVVGSLERYRTASIQQTVHTGPVGAIPEACGRLVFFQ